MKDLPLFGGCWCPSCCDILDVVDTMILLMLILVMEVGYCRGGDLGLLLPLFGSGPSGTNDGNGGHGDDAYIIIAQEHMHRLLILGMALMLIILARISSSQDRSWNPFSSSAS